MRKVKIFVILFCLGSALLQAQDENKIWSVSAGINTVDFNKGGFKDYFGSGDWNTNSGALSLSLSRYVNYGFSLKLSGSINKITKGIEGDFRELNFSSIDATIIYDLNSLFGDTGFFDPNLTLGSSSVKIDNDAILTLSPGLGFNSWFNDSLGLSVNSTYNMGTYYDSQEITGSSSYFQHTIGLIYKFGRQSRYKDSDGDGVPDLTDLCPGLIGSIGNSGCPDSDGDGVVNRLDLCPEIPGSKTTDGCPDSDGDSVVDKDDLCPTVFGSKTTDGCPDSDGDGVIDKDDLCPNLVGDIQGGGCPDSDGDGVIDKDDLCPQSIGSFQTGGCPDSDGDGVADKNDLCPNIEGSVAKEGCPEITEIQIKKLINFSKTIRFNSGKTTFKPGVSVRLDELAIVMLEYPTTKFIINGYSDSTGSVTNNLKISKQRAKAVKDYLISKGVNSLNLDYEGYGVDNPIATNKTSKGREANRRVEILAK